jgi:Abortive infection alpha
MANASEQRRLNAGNGDGGVDLIRAAPVLARLAFAAWLRATGWTLQASLAASSRVVRGAANGESPATILRNVEGELRDYVRQMLGIEADGAGSDDDPEPVDAEVVEDDRLTVDDLREQGRDLLRRSADVYDDDEAHPAYARILQQLAPDEARILRLLAREGPQPAVDVRTAGPLAIARSEMVAPGLNMIGPAAGAKHPDKIKPYLDNLARLGLIWFSREPLQDPLEYQVLEAQPDVAEAMEEAGRGKTVRRSIHLTDFGENFCELVLPEDTAELKAIQRGDKSPEGKKKTTKKKSKS